MTKLNEAEIFASAAVTGLKLPSAPGTAVKESAKAVVDYSNANEGYIGVKYTGKSKPQLKITAPSGNAYDYVFTPTGDWQYFVLSEGSGTYTIALYEIIVANKAMPVTNVSIEANIADSTAPFQYPNCYVNYSGSSKAVKLAAYLAKSCKTEMQLIEAVYNYVVTNIKYDYNLAKTVTSNYISDPDTVITNKTGICFDYAALMTAMLRSRGIPVFNNVAEQLGVRLSGAAGVFTGIGIFLSENALWIVFVLLAALVIAGILIWRNFAGTKWGLSIAAARFSAAMSMGISSGLDIDRSMTLAKKLSDNPVMNSRAETCRNLMEEGMSFPAAAAQSGIFRTFYAKMLSVGAAAGALDTMMQEIADRCDDEVTDELEGVINRLEPILVIVMSLLVGLILLSVMLPLTQVMTAF